MEFGKYVKWRSEKFGAVVFDTLNEKVYVTNEAGGEVLSLIDEGLELSKLVECLREKYVEDEAQVGSDVAAFIKELCSRGLLACGPEEKAWAMS